MPDSELTSLSALLSKPLRHASVMRACATMVLAERIAPVTALVMKMDAVGYCSVRASTSEIERAFIDLMALKREFISEWTRCHGCEQDQDHRILMDVHAQQPPDKKESNDCKENTLDPLACGSGLASTFHGWILAFTLVDHAAFFFLSAQCFFMACTEK